jgi:hypothetical protein
VKPLIHPRNPRLPAPTALNALFCGSACRQRRLLLPQVSSVQTGPEGFDIVDIRLPNSNFAATANTGYPVQSVAREIRQFSNMDAAGSLASLVSAAQCSALTQINKQTRKPFTARRQVSSFSN